MAQNFTIIQSISPQQQQTLDIPNEDDNNMVNIEDDHTSYTFEINPLFIPSSSSSSCSFHNHNNQVNFNNNSCSSCSSESDTELCPDSSSLVVYPHAFHNSNDYNDDQYDQMDFITDLFDTRRDRYSVNENENEVNDGNEDDDDLVSSGVDELGLGLSGLRVAGIESDSDTEELGRVDERNDDGNDESVGRTSLERFWDCPSFDNEEREREREEGLSSVIERIEEISISSLTSDGDATAEALEWEILLAVNNLERDMEIDFETDGGGEGFVYTPEFDTLIGQFVETVRALRGSPPAAKSIVDNLPLVEMKGDGNADDQVICAVCKDGILVEEKVMELPCRHLYHGECIVPWLSIRNTCPVCRFELPTDDVDYERSKNRVNEEEMGFELFT